LPSQYLTAFGDCRSDLPTGGPGGGGGFGLNSQASAAYRECLEVHGVTLPTTTTTAPGSTSTGGTGGTGGGFNGGEFASLRNNPTFQAASKACASLLPARPGSTTTTVPASS
jgi:hypothetical protein